MFYIEYKNLTEKCCFEESLTIAL